MGDATWWQQLFDYVKDMVKITEYMTKDVVTTSKVFEIAKKIYVWVRYKSSEEWDHFWRNFSRMR